MTLTTRIRTADPLAGELPEALPAPALEADEHLRAPERRGARASRSPRRARGPRRLVVAGAVVAVLVGVVVVAVGLLGSSSGVGGRATTFAVSSLSGGGASPALVQRSATVLRTRLASLDAGGWTVTASDDSVRAACDGCAGDDVRVAASVAQPGKLMVYDWEANVLDARCRPAPGSTAVTGGFAAGQSAAGSLSYYAAVVRAARCPAREFSTMSHGTPQFYAIDRGRQRVLSGPAVSRAAAEEASGGASGASGAEVVRVRPGTVLLEAESPQGGRPRDPADAQWYVLRDRAALTGADVVAPRVADDAITGRPVVHLGFTPAGRRAWQQTTRRIAHRGADHLRPGGSSTDAAQHFAVALDGRLLTVPYVDFRQNPDGIDGLDGTEIAGGLTRASARTLVALLKSGTLPARLTPTHRG